MRPAILKTAAAIASLCIPSFCALWSGVALGDVAVGNPTACTNVDDPARQDWTRPDRAQNDDNRYATASVDDWRATDYLQCTGYNFNLPTDATINGITVSISRYASNAAVRDLAVRVVKGGTVGDDDRSLATSFPTTATWQDYGGAYDMWSESWTAADVNSAGFGAAFAAQKASTSGGSRTVYVNQIRIYVYYTRAPSTGVINTYYPGSGTVAAGATSITVGTAAGNSTPIVAGDQVLVMQMQDAEIHDSNDDAYGDNTSGDSVGRGATAFGNAGRFEYAVAANDVPVSGGTLTLTCGTVNSYATDAATGTRGKRTFQVIRVPVYNDYTLGDVTALAWNGSVGGVLAFDARGNVDLNGRTISVAGQGFRGGGGRGSTSGSGAYTDYVTPQSNGANGSKGEGIAGTPYYVFTAPSTLTNTGIDGYPSGSFGRGAPANGGGGGTDRNPERNDQNSGGGGGANGGSGGIGGIGWCPSFDGNSPPYYGCGYAALASGLNPGGGSGGFGGAGVTGLGATRLTLGGGGGAATTNNSTGTGGALASSGAAGGGIIMIRAGTLSGTATFNANGSDANSTVRNDGSGGGGAGGAVLISAGSGMEGVTISVRGGAGGSNLVPPGTTSNPHGPGGGGGGGYAITTGVPGGCDSSGGDSGVTYTQATDASGNTYGVLFGAYGSLPGGSGGCSSGLAEGDIPGATRGGVQRCAFGLHHFTIDYGFGDASTCVARPVAFSARDRFNRVITDYTGTMRLSTTTANGTWSTNDGADTGPDPATGTLADPSADDGAASYVFAATDRGTVALFLSDAHQESLSIMARDTAAGVSTTVGTLTFRDSALVIEPTTCTGGTCATATGSTEVVAGRDHGFNITRLTRAGGTCGTATTYDGNTWLRFWITRFNPDDPLGATPAIQTVTQPATTLPDGNPGANNFPINFTDGVGSFTLVTTDVGKYAIHVVDSNASIEGTSDTLTVRPFGIAFSGIASGTTDNPGGTASSGAKFVSAGTRFSAAVRAYRWSNTDDVNGDGIPDDGAALTDNARTASFAWDTALAVASFTPSGGSEGALTATPSAAVVRDAFTGGTGTNATLRYSEVGSIVLTATASDYLNTPSVDLRATSGNIGRFFPDHFVLSGDGVSPFCSSFSYMRQPLTLAYKLTAQNALNSTTGNYDAAKGYTHTLPAPVLVAESGDSGNNAALSSRLSAVHPEPEPAWTAGEYNFGGTFQFARADIPDGPYDALQVGIRVVDSDGTVLSGRNMNAGATGDCTTASVAGERCDAVTLGAAASMRYGRAYIENANGSELVDLKIPFSIQYYTASGFYTNASDTCTAGGALSRVDPNEDDSLTDEEVCVWDNGDITKIKCDGTAPTLPTDESFTSPAAAGRFNLWLKSPGAGNTGSMIINATVPAWLQFDWDGDTETADTGPSGQATFGIYRGSRRHIYLRELVN